MAESKRSILVDPIPGPDFTIYRYTEDHAPDPLGEDPAAGREVLRNDDLPSACLRDAEGRQSYSCAPPLLVQCGEKITEVRALACRAYRGRFWSVTIRCDERGQDNVEYETFLKIAAPRSEDDGFHWLWRSSLADYVNCNRIWHKWLNRMLLSWYRNLLRYKSVWRNSFEIYDELTRDPFEEIEEFAPEESELYSVMAGWGKIGTEEYDGNLKAYLKKYKVNYLPQVKVRVSFRSLLDVLLKEIKQASEATRASKPDDDAAEE